MEVNIKELKVKKLLELHENTLGNMILKEIDEKGLTRELEANKKRNQPLIDESEKKIAELEALVQEINDKDIQKGQKKKELREPLIQLEELKRNLPLLRNDIMKYEAELKKNAQAQEMMQHVAQDIQDSLKDYGVKIK